MGLDIGLKWSTELAPMQALRLLADHFGLAWGDNVRLVGPALGIWAVALDEESRSLFEQDFHFKPDMIVGFRLSSNSPEYEEGYRVVVRAALFLLEHGGDGVLLFNGEHIVLQRIGGALVLNADRGNWKDGLCLEREVHSPHEIRSLPSPLL
ncbi:hypothetical protein JGU66_07525 [Myxococcaceae bacterium JPH2]|nr:hypothetical protein [Myxococcaceae bacterium JPH2]